MKEQKITYIDTETTGLNADKNQILTIGYLFENDGKVLDEGTLRIKQMPHARVHPKALDTHGISLEAHNEIAKPEKDILTKFNKIIRDHNFSDSVISGHNVSFDREFINKAYDRRDMEWLLKGNDVADTYKIAGDLKSKQKLDAPSLSLENLAKKYDFDTDFHSALADAKATRHVHKELKEMKNE